MLGSAHWPLPSVVVAVVREHLAEFRPSDPDDLIFKGPKGAALRRNDFHRSARWPECVAEAGLPEGFRFHDLRHTGTRWRPRRGRAHAS